MSNLISIEDLISNAKEKGVDFGKGDPYNRLRYYTKIGWLPHMTRKQDSEGSVKGHYPQWTLERILLIEDLKSKGIPNDEITKKLVTRNKLQTATSLLKSKETINQAVAYLALLSLIVVVINESGLSFFGQNKNNLKQISQSAIPGQILETGNSFVPEGQSGVFVKSSNISSGSKVYVTFNQDYSPATRYWISIKENAQGFGIELDAPVYKDSEFNWWISQ